MGFEPTTHCLLVHVRTCPVLYTCTYLSSTIYMYVPVQYYIHVRTCPVLYTCTYLSSTIYMYVPVQYYIHVRTCPVLYTCTYLSSTIYMYVPVQYYIHVRTCPILYTCTYLSSTIYMYVPVQYYIHVRTCPVLYTCTYLSNTIYMYVPVQYFIVPVQYYISSQHLWAGVNQRARLHFLSHDVLCVLYLVFSMETFSSLHVTEMVLRGAMVSFQLPFSDRKAFSEETKVYLSWRKGGNTQ